MKKEILLIDVENVIARVKSAIDEKSQPGMNPKLKTIISVFGLSDKYCSEVVRKVTLALEASGFTDYRQLPLSHFNRVLPSSSGQELYLTTDLEGLDEKLRTFDSCSVLFIHGTFMPLNSMVPFILNKFQEAEHQFYFTRPSGSFMKKSYSRIAAKNYRTTAAKAPSLGPERLHLLFVKIAKKLPEAVEGFCDDKLKLAYSPLAQKDHQVVVVVDNLLESQISLIG